MMDAAEFSSLKESISKGGLKEQIWLYEGKILDGRNRYLACLEVGIEPEFREFRGTDEQALEAVIAWNLERRHLSSWQKAAIATEADGLFEELTEQAKARQLSTLKQNQPKEECGNVAIAPLPPTATVVENFPQRVDTRPEESKTRAKLAQSFGTNSRYVQDALRIKAEAPEVLEASKQGVLSGPQAKSIAQLQPEQRQEAIQVLQETPKSKRSAALNALLSSESNEWYTPAQYVEAARRVMGQIDLDPASNAVANEVVRAEVFYGIEDNGLSQPWSGCVFLNPPYGQDNDKNASNQAIWARRLIDEYESGSVTQAILLVNAATSAKWFEPLFEHIICFTNHRIKFYRPGADANSPTQSNAIVYMGDRVDSFAEEFKEFGAVVKKLVEHSNESI
jgi:ParB-like chromosome segregation protein Spo0J